MAGDADEASGGGLSIRTKLLSMMLLTSLLGLGTITYLAYQEGRKALVEAATDQLTSYRSAKKQQIEWYFRNLTDTFSILGSDIGVLQSFLDFKSAYKTLGKTPLDDKSREKLAAYYKEHVLPRLSDGSGEPPGLEDVLPKNNATLELQALYIVENDHPLGQKHKLISHPRITPYTTAHSRHHGWLRSAMFRLGYFDIFLIDAESGNIVYSVSKEVDLGTNVLTGNTSRTHLAKIVRETIQARRRNQVRMTDYEFYTVSGGPHAFVATPIYADAELVGILAAQVSTEQLNKFIHNGRQWETTGLGKTGSAYLASLVDHKMRSDSREIFEDPDAFIAKLESSRSFTREVIDRIRKDKSTILHYPVNPEPILEAAKGRSGTMLVPSRKGGNVLISYAPLDIPEVRWAVLTRMDESEVLASQISFNRTILTVGCLLALLTTLAALGVARSFLKPVNALLDGIERLRKGDRAVSIAQTTRDEFGDLVTAFNGMASDIRMRDEVIEGKNQAYAQLLKRIFPETAADRLRQGEANIAENFEQVTVIYAIVDGLDGASQDLGSEAATQILNGLVDAFDNAADKCGVEKVKTIGDHYLAVCGLEVARLDHAKRALEFAVAMHRELAVAEQMNNLDLTLRVGIATGPIQAGLVGNRRFVYDIWGFAASIARRIVYDADVDAARISLETYNALPDTTDLGEALDVKTKAHGVLKTYQYRFSRPDHTDTLSGAAPTQRAAE